MKVPCGVIRDLLPLYAENLAGEESKKLVEEHLSECEPCQQELEKLKGGPSQQLVPAGGRHGDPRGELVAGRHIGQARAAGGQGIVAILEA